MELRDLQALLDKLKAVHQRPNLPVVNIGARVFGIVMSIFSVLLLISGIYYTMRPEAAADFESAGGPPGMVNIVLAVLVGLLGFAFLRMPPYRPDLGDPPWSSGHRPNHTARRNWWTGGLKK